VPLDTVTALKERLYGDQIDGTTLFHKFICDHLSKEAYVLDLGCGRGNQAMDLRPHAAFVLGCDLRREIQENDWVSTAVRGNAYNLPFQQGSFHLVLMDYVLEHLRYPFQCAREIGRILKPNGILIVRTPNLYHYVSVISRMTPHWFHRLAADRARGLTRSSDGDVLKTYYRANTVRGVSDVFRRAGFLIEKIMLVEREPSYLMFARPAFLLGYCYERLVNRYERLAGFRSNIFAVVRKPRS
jgi:ubiquinone/menaquinone biosynthesis C-methylase UbiE